MKQTPKPIIQITISPDGEVQMKVQGAQGGRCKALTAGLEKSLGTPSKRTLTAEFYEAEPATTTTRKIQQ